MGFLYRFLEFGLKSLTFQFSSKLPYLQWFFSTIFWQLQANACRNSELDRKITEFGQDLGPFKLYMQGFWAILTQLSYICKVFASNFRNFELHSLVKSAFAELASKWWSFAKYTKRATILLLIPLLTTSDAIFLQAWNMYVLSNPGRELTYSRIDAVRCHHPVPRIDRKISSPLPAPSPHHLSSPSSMSPYSPAASPGVKKSMSR